MTRVTSSIRQFFLGLIALGNASAFTKSFSTLSSTLHRRLAPLQGLQEWLGGNASYDGFASAEKTRKRPLCVLPFEIPELLMPGQTRYLHFYEPRFVKLGEKAQNQHHGIVALAFFSGSEGAMLRVCTLCQIDEYTKLDVGIGLTVRGVGRCNIDDITGMGDFIEADVTLYEDENEDETEEGMPGHDGRIAQLGEVVFKLSDDLSEGGKEAGIDVSAKELDSDPRSILQSGETLEQAVRRMEQAAAEQQQKEEGKGAKGAAAGGGGGKGKGKGGAGAGKAAKKGAGNAGDEQPSLRRRVALARAVQTRSISAAPRDDSERRLEMELASFLGLEGAPIQTKLKAFLSQDLGARMELAADALEERSKMLSARRSLMNLNLGTSTGKAESSDDLDLDLDSV